MSIPEKVVLLGANGAIGRGLSPLLGARSVEHRVVGRNYLALQVRFQGVPCCEHYPWDPTDRDAFERACEGSGTVVYLIGVPIWKFPEHLPLIDRALKAAQTAGARRFLLVSSNWSYSQAQAGARLREDAPRSPQPVKGKIRRDQEDRVLAAHRTGSFATAVLRIADFYGPRVEASFLWSAFQSAKSGAVAQILGPVDRPREFVYVEDAAATIADMLEADAAWDGPTGTAWNLGGIGPTTTEAMVRAIFATEGKPPNYKVPGPLVLRFVRSMNPWVRELRELRSLVEQPVFLDDTRIATLLGGLRKTPYAEAIRQTLALR